jgi:hypothetical protein
VIISEDSDWTVLVICKGLGLRPDGQVRGVTYNDVVTRTADGWRIVERVAIGRRPDRIPEVSRSDGREQQPRRDPQPRPAPVLGERRPGRRPGPAGRLTDPRRGTFAGPVG